MENFSQSNNSLQEQSSQTQPNRPLQPVTGPSKLDSSSAGIIVPFVRGPLGQEICLVGPIVQTDSSKEEGYKYPESVIIRAPALMLGSAFVVPNAAPEVPITMTSTKVHYCSVCEKNYSRASALAVHMRKHTGEKPFKCPDCSKEFSESGNLKTHMRRHTGEKPFQCSVCRKCFTTQGHLTDHFRQHTNERPFQCPHCVKAFRRSSTLVVHIRKHTGHKPYVCNFCEKPFAESGNLRTHLRKHTGERPYVCPDGTCGKAFKTKGHLVDHLKTKRHQKNE